MGTRQRVRILVIDDQFGRCGLGRRFRNSVSAEVFTGYEADRRNLCLNYGLIDITGDVRSKNAGAAIAEAVFSPAQIWNDSEKRIENSLETAVQAVRRGWPFQDGTRWALVLLDLRFVYGTLNAFGDPQEGSVFGVDVLLPELRATFGDDLPIVVLSSTRKEENNAIVRRLGALDFIQRIPGAGAPPEQSRKTLERALFQHGLMEDSNNTIIGRSLPVLKMLRQARRGAVSAKNILLVGETGSGKGLVARYIHAVSARSRGPMEVFHAAHRPAELQADELFGHWKGAFTGALTDTPGIWERANGGTLFIDEVADIDLKVQQMLMQPIEERKVRRLGQPPSRSTRFNDVDVLVVLATNRNLSDSASSGAMKADFLNRINAFAITVPPLRERREDIPRLVIHLATTISPVWNGKFLPETMDVLYKHDWREGNIRELRNVVERAITNNPVQDITASDIYFTNTRPESSPSHGAATPNDPPWRRLIEILLKRPETLALADAEEVRRELKGSFPDLLAHIITWAFEMHRTNGKLNPTAAVRFLLGRDTVTTMEAKQFLKKAMTLDTRGRQVSKKLFATGIAAEHEMLARLLRECLDSDATRAESNNKSSGRKRS